LNKLYVNANGKKLTYYQFFGVEEKASNEELKKSFRVMAIKYHPDKNTNKEMAEQNFKVVNTVWQILCDEVKRRNYDHLLAVDRGQVAAQQGFVVWVTYSWGNSNTATTTGGYYA